MRKAIKILSAGLVLTSLIVLPLVVSGQVTTAAECCRLNRNITYVGLTSAGNGANCSFAPGSTELIKDTVVGAGDCLNSGTEPDTCVLKGISVAIAQESAEWGTICLLNGLYNVTDWIFYFFLAIAILIGVIAGFEFMTAAGDPGKIDKARGLLMYMIIGLIVAALAKVIPTMVRAVIGF